MDLEASKMIESVQDPVGAIWHDLSSNIYKHARTVFDCHP